MTIKYGRYVLNDGTEIEAVVPVDANGVPATPAQINGSIPTVSPGITANGDITTQNLVPAGVATAGSAVQLILSGQSNLTVQVTGAYTGALSLQSTVNGLTWVTRTDLCFLSVAGAATNSIASATQAIFQCNVYGASAVRITGLSAMTGTPNVTLLADNNSPAWAIYSILPGTGVANLGKSEDAAHASGDTGVFVLGVRNDVLLAAGSTSTTIDYSQLTTDLYGAMLTRPYEKQARTYSCSVNVAAAAAATDIATITGSATTTVYITKVIVSGTQTTAGVVDIVLLKRSTANTGSGAGGTNVPLDSSDAAATATVLAYTVNPTPGTLVGNVRRAYLAVGGATSLSDTPLTFEFGDKGRPLILRGIAQVLAVNLNGATVTGGTFDVTWEWFEI